MKMLKKLIAITTITLLFAVTTPVFAGPNPSCTQEHLDVVSDTTSKVVDINGAPLNQNAVLVSTVPAIQTLGPGVWGADVGNVDAKWIWSEDTVTGWDVDKWVTFEKEFTIVGTPATGTLKIASDNSYEVWVNKAVSPTPDFSDPSEDNHSIADTYDVTSLLQSGVNKITIKVLNKGLPGPWQNNPGGLLFNLTADSQYCPPPVPPCCGGKVEVNNSNNATVINNVTTISRTGGNSANGGTASSYVRGGNVRRADDSNSAGNVTTTGGGAGGYVSSGNASSNSSVRNTVNVNVVRVKRGGFVIPMPI